MEEVATPEAFERDRGLVKVLQHAAQTPLLGDCSE